MSKGDGEARITRRHVLLYDDDWTFLVERFSSNIGVSKAVRTIVRRAVAKIRAKAAYSARPLTDLIKDDDGPPSASE